MMAPKPQPLTACTIKPGLGVRWHLHKRKIRSCSILHSITLEQIHTIKYVTPGSTPAYWWLTWAITITQTKIKINYGSYSNDLPSLYFSKANKEATRQSRYNFLKPLSFSAASNSVSNLDPLYCMCRCIDVICGFRFSFVNHTFH